MSEDQQRNISCPIPISEYDKVMLAHGGGGRLMQQLIDKMFRVTFANPELDQKHDGAVIDVPKGKLALTTDSYVVYPLFFPGGDIGKLAVYGTVNDLAMCGARPLYLTAGFIIEEGLPLDTLWRVVQSMQKAADVAGVRIVTGDTKVVDHGKAHDLFINTAGVGLIEHSLVINPMSVRSGDAILINGDIGRHGIAIMAEREGLEFETTIESDCAPLAQVVDKLISAGIKVHCLRDLTRGGLAAAFVEIAETADIHIRIEEKKIPVTEQVRAACEILGFEPTYVANEGRFVAFIPQSDIDRALAIMREFPDMNSACLIGHVSDGDAGQVTIRNPFGVERILDLPSGEQLPRIC
jgi:hydrogenase expression/formation protein HypE